MRIHLRLAFQEGMLPLGATAHPDDVYMAPAQWLRWLEWHLGFSHPDREVDHLRVEQYRQALHRYITSSQDAFFLASFTADDLGTAEALLSMRDELLAAGWDFRHTDTLSPRLQVLAAVEMYWQDAEVALSLFPGEADRIHALLQDFPAMGSRIEKIFIYDDTSFFSPGWQRVLQAMADQGIPMERGALPRITPHPATDLQQWQAFLAGNLKEKPVLRGDGTLLVVRAYRDTHLAAWTAQCLRQNSFYQPSIVLPNPNRTLDNALSMEGLPSLGIPSASLARPGLQVLKLAPVFLWNPIDPYKIMEFVSLSVKPLESGLSQRIAAFLADTPGLFSDRWFAMIREYFEEELPQRLQFHTKKTVEDVRRDFNFWFSRKRVDSRKEKVPKTEVIALYSYLQQWALKQGREEDAPTLMVLAAQSRRIVELLEALPEESLGYLALERIVRTIYEPAPLHYRQAEAGHFDMALHPAAVAGPVENLLWWDFFEQEPDYFFSRWYPDELAYLSSCGVHLMQPEQQNQRLIAQRKRPVLWVTQSLLLCQPDAYNGGEVAMHPLMGDLMAAFGEDLSLITLHIDTQKVGAAWQSSWQLPLFHVAQPCPLPKPQPFLNIKQALSGRTEETPTSLENLLYYPYQWVLRHHIKLRQSSILSVVRDPRLMGNLAHRLVEKLLLHEQALAWERPRLDQWIEQQVPVLLEKEGATLLLYGREPEKMAFTKQMKYAAWSLLSLIRDNGWTVLAAEQELSGELGDLHLRGRADLVLSRGNERAIIDLKWSGAARYTALMTNEEDIQLALYAWLLEPKGEWPHTAYFIMDKGKVLVRNQKAFSNIQPLKQESDHTVVYDRLIESILATWHWRQQQLNKGMVEIRCQQTELDLEEYYNTTNLMELLEMKAGDARFDDYRVLIGIVN
ncbi:MAG: PD-(D/E)XK nuclease family protein [Saprospiraceae bacterium]